MCGIVGMYTTEKYGLGVSADDKLLGMLVLDSLRGIHSTGVFGTHEKSSQFGPDVVKTVGNPYEFNRTPEATRFYKNIAPRYDAVVGHNRYATVGKVNAQNAHPFIEGNITLVHNGSLYPHNYNSLARDYKDVEVDSQLLAKMIDKEGLEETVYSAYGAMALVWYNKETDTLNFFRNKERPFHIAKDRNRHTIYFASEAATLVWLGAKYNLQFDNLWELPALQHYCYNRGDITPEINTLREYRATTSTYKPKENVYTKNSNGTFDTLEVGDFVDVSVVDINSGTGNFPNIYGNGVSEDYPEIYFNFSYKGAEKDIYECDYISGQISYIALVSAETSLDLFQKGFRWRVFLTDIEPKYNLVIQTDDWLQLADSEMISSERFKELLEAQGNTCGWCTEKVTIADASNSTIGIYPIEGQSRQLILCPACTKLMAAPIGEC